MEYSVRVLTMAEIDAPGASVFWGGHYDRWDPLYFYMVVMQGDGKTIVINTGLPQPVDELNAHWEAWAGERCRARVSDEMKPQNALASIGLAPSQVDVVIITPMVAYATANIPLFDRAEIYLSKRGWLDYHAPELPYGVPRDHLIPPAVAVHLVTDAWPRLHLLGDEGEVLPGITTFWTGVHHRSSMAVKIHTSKGHVVAGDSFWYYEHIEKNIPIGLAESLEEAGIAYERIRHEADLLLPLYDPELLQRHPGGIIA